MSGVCLKCVRRLSGWCLEGVCWVSRGCLERIWPGLGGQRAEAEGGHNVWAEQGLRAEWQEPWTEFTPWRGEDTGTTSNTSRVKRMKYNLVLDITMVTITIKHPNMSWCTNLYWPIHNSIWGLVLDKGHLSLLKLSFIWEGGGALNPSQLSILLVQKFFNTHIYGVANWPNWSPLQAPHWGNLLTAHLCKGGLFF